MAVRLEPRPADVPARAAPGQTAPRAIAWFGVTSFSGHVRRAIGQVDPVRGSPALLVDSFRWEP